MRKQKHYPYQDDDVENLKAEGFSIHRFSHSHWRITKEEYEIKVDVWPTVRKIYIVDGGMKSYVYRSLFDEVIKIFKRTARV